MYEICQSYFDIFDEQQRKNTNHFIYMPTIIKTSSSNTLHYSETYKNYMCLYARQLGENLTSMLKKYHSPLTSAEYYKTTGSPDRIQRKI